MSYFVPRYAKWWKVGHFTLFVCAVSSVTHDAVGVVSKMQFVQTIIHFWRAIATRPLFGKRLSMIECARTLPWGWGWTHLRVAMRTGCVGVLLYSRNWMRQRVAMGTERICAFPWERPSVAIGTDCARTLPRKDDMVFVSRDQWFHVLPLKRCRHVGGADDCWWQLSTRCSCPCALLAHVSRARIYLSAYENFLLYLNVILPCTCVYTLHVRNFCVVWECRCAALKITQHHKLLSFSPLLDEKSEMERILILNRFRRARARWRRCVRQKLRICKLELISLQTNLGGALLFKFQIFFGPNDIHLTIFTKESHNVQAQWCRKRGSGNLFIKVKLYYF